MAAFIDLLQTQKNDILKLIKQSGHDPFNFKWMQVVSKYLPYTNVPKLLYKGSGYSFIFDRNNNQDKYVIYSPGEDTLVSMERARGWIQQEVSLKKWLENIKRELQSPDEWAALSGYKLPQDADIDDDAPNGPFTVIEVKQLEAGLKKTDEYLKSLVAGDKGKLALINAKIEYLSEAAMRQGRRDWFHTYVGAMMSLAVQAALSPEQMQKPWLLLKETVSGIVKFSDKILSKQTKNEEQPNEK